MRSRLLTPTVAALLLGGASLAQARYTGFYAGVGAGQALVGERAYDDEDTASSVFRGDQFHRNFALEADYTDFGKLEPRGEGTGLELGSTSLTAVGILPFTATFSGYARAGLQRWDLDHAIPGLTGTARNDGTDPVYGPGLEYRFSDLVALRGGYTRSEVEDLDADAAQVQVRFDF